ncbi:MAG: hypothetical protein MR456_02935 [Spirochaetia bacterium]|nr:hypothetical protein [Spirochaetia bacterium]
MLRSFTPPTKHVGLFGNNFTFKFTPQPNPAKLSILSVELTLYAKDVAL